MSFFINGNTLQLKTACWFNGQLSLNILHYYCGSHVGTGASTKEIADVLSPLFAPLYKSLMTNGALYLGLSAKNLSDMPATLADVSTISNGPGTAGTTPLPTQVSGCITLRSIFAGRANRGRCYPGFPDATDMDTDETPTVGYVTELQSLGAQIIAETTIVGGSGSSTIGCLIKHASPSLEGNIATSVAVLKKWATQRRRGDRGANNPRSVPL